jgi:hypothetical protein
MALMVVLEVLVILVLLVLLVFDMVKPSPGWRRKQAPDEW